MALKTEKRVLAKVNMPNEAFAMIPTVPYRANSAKGPKPNIPIVQITAAAADNIPAKNKLVFILLWKRMR